MIIKRTHDPNFGVKGYGTGVKSCHSVVGSMTPNATLGYAMGHRVWVFMSHTYTKIRYDATCNPWAWGTGACTVFSTGVSNCHIDTTLFLKLSGIPNSMILGGRSFINGRFF